MPDSVRILYMEDEAGVARLLQKRMSRLGYSIDIAADGEAGLAMFEAGNYALVMVDYQMPGLSGLQVMRQLASHERAPALIMLTATGNERTAVEALKVGATDYVIKDAEGVYLELLPTVIEQSLQQRQLLLEKRRIEQALEHSERYHRALVENSFDLIALVNEKGELRYLSPSFVDIFGSDWQDLMGIGGVEYLTARVPESIDPRMAEHGIQFFHRLLENPGQPMETQLRIKDKKGQWRWLEIRGKNLLSEPWIESLVFNIRDITERNTMERALRESEERFRMLFEEAPDPYIICDLKGNLLDCNRAVEPLLDLNRAELIGRNLVEMQLLEPDELEKATNIFTDLTQDPNAKPHELTLTRPDNQRVVVDLRIIPIQTQGQTQILGIAHDITWRKQAETQFKTHINQLETLRRVDDELTRQLILQYVLTMAEDVMMRLSGAKAGAIVVMVDGIVRHLHAFGYTQTLDPDAILDQRSIFARVTRQKEAEWVRDVRSDPDYLRLLQDSCSQITIPLLSQDRLVGVVVLETNNRDRFTSDIFDFLKLIASRVAVAIDNAQLYNTSQQHLIQLQDLYTQISKLEQLKTDMIRIASHDLRNPLSVFLTYLSLLKTSLGNKLTEKQERYLQHMNTSIHHMESIIAEFLSLDRVERIAQDDHNGELVNISELVQHVFAGYRMQAEQKQQEYHVFAPEAAITIRVLKVEIQQAVANLIGNAIKYTPIGGTISVVVRKEDQYVQVEVTDTGYGVPTEQQVKMFQPFFRAQTQETAAIEGTGLGLYLVKKIVERNGGKIIFHSEYGRGSTFGFEVPLAAE
ncbi:MAG: PAS domain S-box protein [Anaerolineae bacterium]|nr:PAS domain S-box protein [Anaerolineae bacterium]